MTSLFSPHSNSLIQRSLPLVEAHRPLIVAGMTRSLAAADPGRGTEWAACAAATLVDMLIDQARHFASGLGPQDLRPGSRVGEVTTAPGVQGSVTHLPQGGEEGEYAELLRQRLMQQEEIRRLEEAGGVGGPTPAPYYLPGPRSTGQLENRLEDQLAARQPAAPPRG